METIKKIADQLLQDAEKETSAGLYNGKAGFSLSLFIAARYLRDESIEDVAFRLLQESLVIKTGDISFENGLSGIGYALLYLIENKYLDADFDEIFGDQYEMIIKFLSTIEKAPLLLLHLWQTVYFLAKVSGIKKEDERIPKIIQKFFEGLELFLIVQFQDFTDARYIRKKADVLDIYKNYRQLVDYSGYRQFSRVLLEDYTVLCRKGVIKSAVNIYPEAHSIKETPLLYCINKQFIQIEK